MSAVTSEIAYSLVVPVYGNESTIDDLVAAIGGIAARLDGPFEAVFVVDGSRDASAERLAAALPGQPYESSIVSLSRNFGSFPATRAGLEIARGEYLAVMAADLQEPPELIDEFFRILVADEADIVVGERTGRDDPLAGRVSSSLFWWVFRRVVQPEMPAGGVDVFGCSRAVGTALLGMTEANSSLVGQLIWMGFRRTSVPYERRARPSGSSAWTFSKKARYMADSIFSFTDLPIRLLLGTGVLGTIGTLLASLFVLIGWATNHIEVPGYTPLMLVVLFSTGAILSGLGIIGSYVWRTYENTKQRPITLVRTTERFPGVHPS